MQISNKLAESQPEHADKQKARKDDVKKPLVDPDDVQDRAVEREGDGPGCPECPDDLGGRSLAAEERLA